MSPPTQHPKQEADGQSSAVDEAQMREQAAMMAMMDDLGIARVEALPLSEDNGRRDHDRGHAGGGHGHGGYGGGTNAHRRRPALPASQPARRAPAHGNTPAAGWNVAQAWTDAIESGVFDDDDAQVVKGLDDLGGGRLYDRVVDQTVRILDQRSNRATHQVEHPVRNNRARANDHGRINIHNLHITAQRQAASQTLGSGSQTKAPSSHGQPSRSQGTALPSRSRNKPANLNPRSRPARRLLPPPQAVPSLAVPAPEMVVDTTARPPFEPENVVLKVSIRFTSRDINVPMPALVYLSSAKKPKLGFFDVVVSYNCHYCHWAISAWYDYGTGTDHLLFVAFQDAGSLQGYQLYFANADDLIEFLSRIRSLKAGDYLDQVESASALSSVTNLAPRSNHIVAATPVVDSSPRTPAALTTLPTAPVSRPGAPVSRDMPLSTHTTQNAATIPAPVPERVASPITNGPTTPSIPVKNVPTEPTGEPKQNSPVELGLDDASATTSQVDLDGVGFLSRQELKHTARVIFQVMFRVYPPGMTAEEWDNLAKGIRAGVVEHMVKDARDRGFSEPRVQAIKDTVNEVLDAEIKVNRARHGDTKGHTDSGSTINGGTQAAQPASSTRTTTGRIQYSVEKLLSLRHAAVDPPDSMANIPHLPRPCEGPHHSITPAHSPYQTTPAISRTQFQRSAGAMDWVLGKAVSPQSAPEQSNSVQNGPEPESETGSAAVISSATPSATRDVGLQNSRWADGAADLKHANAFTGPAYEKAWSKRSYLEDLAQLDPQTRVNAAAEDLMDLYFPLPNDGPSEPQTSVTEDTQQLAVAPREAGSATPTRSDKIENLRVGISRLSIWSPTSMPPGRAVAPVQTPSSVVQASRELWAHTTSTVSTQPPSSTAAPITPGLSQPSSSPLAPSDGFTHVNPLRVASLQSNSTMTAQSTASPPVSRMAARHAAPLPVSAQLSASPVAQIARTAHPHSSQVFTPPPSYMLSVRAASSSVSMPQPKAPAAQAKPRGLAASRHASGGVPSSSENFKFFVPQDSPQGAGE